MRGREEHVSGGKQVLALAQGGWEDSKVWQQLLPSAKGCLRNVLSIGFLIEKTHPPHTHTHSRAHTHN